MHIFVLVAHWQLPNQETPLQETPKGFLSKTWEHSARRRSVHTERCTSRSQHDVSPISLLTLWISGGFDSSIILIQRGGIPRPIGDFPDSLSQAMLVGVMLVGRLGVIPGLIIITTIIITLLLLVLLSLLLLLLLLLLLWLLYLNPLPVCAR